MKKFSKASDIKVGAIGYGISFRMGKNHLETMRKFGMKPVCITDTSPQCLKEGKKDFPGIELYASTTEMLKKSDVDLLVIITPHINHAQIANQCMRAGKHLVVEKPMAITTSECDSMIRTAKKNNVVLSVFHNRHWDPNIIQAVQKIKSGIIGDVMHVKIKKGVWNNPGDWWRASKTISGGVLYDWGVHLLEYGLQIIKSPITEVCGFIQKGFWKSNNKWKNDVIEDEGVSMLRFKNGKWLELCVTNIDSKEKPYFLEVTGTKGTYMMSHKNYKIIKWKPNGTRTTVKGKLPVDKSWDLYYQNLTNHLTKGEKLVISAKLARNLIHILELTEKSAQQGKSLTPKLI